MKFYLVIVMLFLFGLPSCAAFRQCVAASGITRPSTIEKQVAQALDSAVTSTSVVSALESIAAGLLPSLGNDVYVLIECAISSWESAHPMPANASPKPSLYAAHTGAMKWVVMHFKVLP